MRSSKYTEHYTDTFITFKEINKASKEIGKIIVNGWVQHGPWAPR
ncbi:hypothetical protein [Enterococcus lactis]